MRNPIVRLQRKDFAAYLDIVPEYELDNFFKHFDLKGIEEVTWEHVSRWLDQRWNSVVGASNGYADGFYEMYGLESIEQVREWHICDWLCLMPEEVTLRGNQTKEWLAWLRATGQRDSDELLSDADLQAYQ